MRDSSRMPPASRLSPGRKGARCPTTRRRTGVVPRSFCRVRWTGNPGWILAGDAGHFKDPIIGQGMRDAMRFGRLWGEAAAPVIDDREALDRAMESVEARRVLAGTVFVLKTGIPWEYLPQELGCGSGMTCWRRLRDWQEAGVWDKLHQLVLSLLHEQGVLDWSVAVADSSSVRAVGAGKKQAPARSIAARQAPSTIC